MREEEDEDVRLKNLLRMLVALSAIIGICGCFVYAVHMDKNPSVSGSIGPIKIEMTVEPNNTNLKQLGETNLP